MTNTSTALLEHGAPMEDETTEQTETRAERKPKRNDLWRCPKCSGTILLHIAVSKAPTCADRRYHTGSYPMELDKKKKSKATDAE